MAFKESQLTKSVCVKPNGSMWNEGAIWNEGSMWNEGSLWN